MTEAVLQRLIQVELTKYGSKLHRNNCGQTFTPDGRPLRFGLFNPGGSDLIGWTEKKITDDMVGLTLAQFTAVEVKSPTGRLTKHQSLFIEAVLAAGGIAVCARSVEDAVGAVRGDAK